MMKNVSKILMAFCLSVLLFSCSDDNVGNLGVAQFVGIWQGSVRGDRNLPLRIVVSEDGSISGNIFESSITPLIFTLEGNVNESGVLSASFTVNQDRGNGNFFGEFSEDTASGTWEAFELEISGTWSAVRSE